mmetsp:Transcript_49615/g.83161  ORF Transcript_49615/g.83161 Transcript_49615/m.83161 type:complete len:369 (-) Transcript_49615:96-1202(-)
MEAQHRRTPTAASHDRRHESVQPVALDLGLFAGFAYQLLGTCSDLDAVGLLILQELVKDIVSVHKRLPGLPRGLIVVLPLHKVLHPVFGLPVFEDLLHDELLVAFTVVLILHFHPLRGAFNGTRVVGQLFALFLRDRSEDCDFDGLSGLRPMDPFDVRRLPIGKCDLARQLLKHHDITHRQHIRNGKAPPAAGQASAVAGPSQPHHIPPHPIFALDPHPVRAFGLWQRSGEFRGQLQPEAPGDVRGQHDLDPRGVPGGLARLLCPFHSRVHGLGLRPHGVVPPKGVIFPSRPAALTRGRDTPRRSTTDGLRDVKVVVCVLDDLPHVAAAHAFLLGVLIAQAFPNGVLNAFGLRGACGAQLLPLGLNAQ